MKRGVGELTTSPAVAMQASCQRGGYDAMVGSRICVP